MDTRSPQTLRHLEPTFVELFTPKLLTVLREGYGVRDLRADAIAGLTVAIVALPLSMAIAIASGVSPDRGLYAAIVGGFVISLLGGSRFQIGGPAGAFIGLLAVVVARHGYDGLALATGVAGLILLAIGLLRAGNTIKYIPLPVTVGFTAGIAVIIVASQVKELLGLQLEHEPVDLLPKAVALWGALPTLNIPTAAIAFLSIATIVTVRRLRPGWPSFLIAVALVSVLVPIFQVEVATVGSRFGAMPDHLPSPSLPTFSWAKLQAVLPDAMAIALLGAIESLLSAVVADGMTGRRHRSNCELAAQGIANLASVAFGGITVTGTIARTATNIRAGARGPIAGLFHSGYLLLFLIVAAPLVAYIPLAALGGVLAVVAWNMTEKEEFRSLLRGSRGDAFVLLVTFLLTIFVNLIVGIGAGVVLGALLLMHRMAEAVEVEVGSPLIAEDESDSAQQREHYDPAQARDPDVMVYRINGAFFFAATARVTSILERIGANPKTFVLDFADVPLIDSTAARALDTIAGKLRREGTTVYFAATRPAVRATLMQAGLTEPHVYYAARVADVPSPSQTGASG